MLTKSKSFTIKMLTNSFTGNRMNFRKFLPTKLFSRSAKKVVHTAADVVAKNPEAESLAQTVIKRATNYAHVAERALHFHLVVFGIVLGFTLMTTIIAVGKLTVALDISFMVANKNLVLNIGYASFFASILYGFIKHYNSKHHERRIKKDATLLEEEYKAKNEVLERKYRERESYLEKRFKESEEKLDTLQQKLMKTEEGGSVWDTISSYSPIGSRKIKDENDAG